LAEHGGFAQDDRNVALLAANPKGPASSMMTWKHGRSLRRFLHALAIDPRELKSVREKKTEVLTGFE